MAENSVVQIQRYLVWDNMNTGPAFNDVQTGRVNFEVVTEFIHLVGIVYEGFRKFLCTRSTRFNIG